LILTRNKRKISENTSITIMRSGLFSNNIYLEIKSPKDFGSQPRDKKLT
jgi:hypothetical protein